MGSKPEAVVILVIAFSLAHLFPHRFRSTWRIAARMPVQYTALRPHYVKKKRKRGLGQLQGLELSLGSTAT